MVTIYVTSDNSAAAMDMGQKPGGMSISTYLNILFVMFTNSLKGAISTLSLRLGFFVPHNTKTCSFTGAK